MELYLLLAVIALFALSLSGGRPGRACFLAGFGLLAGYVAYRGWHLGRLPVAERHDILLVMAALIAGSAFFLRRRVPQDVLLNVLPLFPIVFCIFGAFQETIDTIEPNMNTWWFTSYLLLFIAGYVLLTLGAASGVFFLMTREEHHERTQHALVLTGWLVFSLSLIAGSVWFYRAYGVYWLWTAKELWTTTTWFYFGFYLHARFLKTLRGPAAAAIGVAGFGVMLFSYLGVAPVLGSPWTQF